MICGLDKLLGAEIVTSERFGEMIYRAASLLAAAFGGHCVYLLFLAGRSYRFEFFYSPYREAAFSLALAVLAWSVGRILLYLLAGR